MSLEQGLVLLNLPIRVSVNDKHVLSDIFSTSCGQFLEIYFIEIYLLEIYLLAKPVKPEK